MATYYANRFAGRKTASGERYDPRALTAAHRTLPLGTVVRVTRVDGEGDAVTVRINDRGPYSSGRIIDLSMAAARRLGMLQEGVVRVRLEVISRPDR
jgi:rare lipoprotein A